LSTTPTSPPGVWRSWGWSIALHVVVAALAVLGVMSWRESEPVAQRLAIEAHVVSAAPSRPTQRPPPPEVVPVPDPVSEPEPVPQPDPEEVARRKEQAEATARREEEQRVLARKAEDARLLEVREREERQRAHEKEQQEKAAREKVEKERAQREQVEREKAEREKAAVDKERQLREAELNAQIAAEERLAAARASGKMDQYVAQITARIESKWIRPPSARPGLECEVSVTQAPGGTVVSARVTRCNGDDAVRESIAAAVLRASPLPLPADAALFERNLVVTFRPKD
jgi:colicin import membrane protein